MLVPCDDQIKVMSHGHWVVKKYVDANWNENIEILHYCYFVSGFHEILCVPQMWSVFASLQRDYKGPIIPAPDI